MGFSETRSRWCLLRIERKKLQWQSTWMLVRVISLMEHFLQNLGTSSAHVDVGQICCVLDDVSMIILIKYWRKKSAVHTATSQNSLRKRSSKQNPRDKFRSLECCSMTTERVICGAPAVSTYITQSFSMMSIVDSVRKNSELLIWKVRKNERQLEA